MNPKKRFHVCIDPDLYKALSSASKELGVSQSTIVVQALRSWLRGRGNRRRFLDNGYERDVPDRGKEL